jgi:hypothetical protein
LFSHQRHGEKEKERKKKQKKESGDSSENGICSCGLPARCCQPAVAGGIIYADLWGELSTHLALQALFTQSFPVSLCYKLSPFQVLGKVTLHPPLSGLRVYLQFVWEVGLPPSPVQFSSHRRFYRLSCS